MNENNYTRKFSLWPKLLLCFFGLYHILVGLIYVVSPNLFFNVFRIEPLNHPFVFQYIGVILGLYGTIFLLSLFDPVKFWYAAPLGLITVSIMIAGSTVVLITNNESPEFFLCHIATYSLWIIPFIHLCKYMYNYKINEFNNSIDYKKLAHEYNTFSGKNLGSLMNKRKVALIFLRHFGCVFCQQLLTQLSDFLKQNPHNDLVPVLVHMTTDEKAQEKLKEFKLMDVEVVSDKNKMLYRSFGLLGGKLYQLYGFRQLLSAILLIIKNKFKPVIGYGDIAQMPGTFVIDKFNIISSFQPEYVHETLELQSFLNKVE